MKYKQPKLVVYINKKMSPEKVYSIAVPNCTPSNSCHRWPPKKQVINKQN